MAKLFDTLVPKAEVSLRDWQMVQQQSQNNLSQIESLLHKSDEMIAVIKGTLIAAERLAKELQDGEKKGNNMTEELEKRDEAVRTIRLQFQQIQERESLSEASLSKAYQTQVLSSYSLREGLTKEELMTWMDFIEQKQRDPIVLTKAFYEDPEWQKDLESIRRELKTDELIFESIEEKRTPESERKTHKQIPRERASNINKHIQ